MPCRITPAQLIEVLSATPIGLSAAALNSVGSITTDTRSLQPGDIFLALRGDNFDGHDFVPQAIAQGATAAIVDRQFPILATQSSDLPLLQVDNALAAYQAIGHWWRQQFTIPVIGITGSVGKTTTKELIAAVLGQQGKVLKSQANFNNEIGVPKTLLELDSSHDYAVVEMGMRGRGQIALLCQIAKPTVAVITTVGTAHIGLLGSEAAIAAAKCELLAEMPSSGIAILNHDNDRLMRVAQTVWSGKTITFGLQGGDVHGQLSPDGQAIQVDGVTLPLPLVGEHNAMNYLAAIAVAQALNLPWQSLAAGVSVVLPGGRAQRYELGQDVVLLDETYNAGLESMLASLKLLTQTPGKRRIAVLGTMKELGDRSPEFHYQVGECAANLGIDHLLILADPAEAEAMSQGAASIAAEKLTTQAQVLARLHQLVKPGDRLLFKASRAVGLDQVVRQFCETYRSV